MFQSGDSDEEQYSIVKDDCHIPVYLWAEHFSRPLNKRNKYMTCLIDKEYKQTKGKYVYLNDSQIMGKTLEKLGIPNICGKVCKKFILNYTSIKFHNKKHTYEKSYKNSSNNWRKPIFLNEPRKSKISKKSNSNFYKNIKHIGNRFQNSYEQEYLSYGGTEVDWSLSKDKDKLVKNLYLNSKSESNKVCVYDNFRSIEKNHQPNKISSEISFDNQLLKSSKTYYKPEAKIKKIFTYKKSVRFNDEDLCTFAPSQGFKNNELLNESERLFDEFMSVSKLKESNKTVDVNDRISLNGNKMLLSLRQNDNSNVHKENVSKEVEFDTHHENNLVKEKYLTITLSDEETDKVSDFAIATKSSLNNSIETCDTEKSKNKLNEIMPTHLTDESATTVASGFKELVQSFNPDNCTQVNKLSFAEGSPLISNRSANIQSNSEMGIEYNKNIHSGVRKINENFPNEQSKVCLLLENHNMTDESHSEDNQRYATEETEAVKLAMKCVHDKLTTYKQNVNSASESGDMKSPDNLLSNKTNFNDITVSVDVVSESLQKTNGLNKESVSEDIVQVGNKNSVPDKTAHEKIKNIIGNALLLLGQDERALHEQNECQKNNYLNNLVIDNSTDLEIISPNKKVADITEKGEEKSGSDFNKEFMHHDSSDESDSLYNEGIAKKSVIISRQSDSEYDESYLEKNDSLVYSSSDLSEVEINETDEKMTDGESEDEIPPSQTVKQKEYLISDIRKNKYKDSENKCFYNKFENISEKSICDNDSTQKNIRKENLSLIHTSSPNDSASEILSSKNVKTRKTLLPALSNATFYNVTDSQSINKFLSNTENNRISVTNALKLNIKPICDIDNVNKTAVLENNIPRIKSCNVHEQDNFDANSDSEKSLKCSVTDTIHLSRMNLLHQKIVNNEEVKANAAQKGKENTSHDSFEADTLATQKEKMYISRPISINVKHKMNFVSEKIILSEDYCKSEIKENKNVTITPPPLSAQNDEWNQTMKHDKLCEKGDHDKGHQGLENIASKNNTTEDCTQIIAMKSFVSNHVSKSAKITVGRRAQLGSNHICKNNTNIKKMEEIKCKSESEVNSSKYFKTKRDYTERKFNPCYSKQLIKKNQIKEKEGGDMWGTSSHGDMKITNQDTFKNDEKIDNTHSNMMNSCGTEDDGESVVINKQFESLTVFENQKLSPNNKNYTQPNADKSITNLILETGESYEEYNVNKEFNYTKLNKNEPLYNQEIKQDYVIINRQSENKCEDNHLTGNNVGLTDEGIVKVSLNKSSESASEDEIQPSQTIERKGYFTPSIQKGDITKSENNYSFKKLENAPQKMIYYDKHTPELNEKERFCVLRTKLPTDTDTERNSCKSTTIRKSLFSPSLQVHDAYLSDASESIQNKCIVSISDVIEVKTKTQNNIIKNTDTKNTSEYSDNIRMKLYELKTDNLVLNSESNINIDRKFSVSDAINISEQYARHEEIKNEEVKTSENTGNNQETEKKKLNYISEKVTFTVEDEKTNVSSPLNIYGEHSILTSHKTKILPEACKNLEQPLPIQLNESNSVNSIPVLDEILMSKKLLQKFTHEDKNKILVQSSSSLKIGDCGLRLRNDKTNNTKICASQLESSKTKMLHCSSPMKLKMFTNKRLIANSVSSPVSITHKTVNDESIIGRGVERMENNSGVVYSTSLNKRTVETNINTFKFGNSDSVILYKNNHENNLKTVTYPNKVNEENNKCHKIYLTTDKIPFQRKNLEENYIPKDKDSQIKCNRKSKYEHKDDIKSVKKLKVSTTGVIKDSRSKNHVEATGVTGEDTKLANTHIISFKGTGNKKTSKNLDSSQPKPITKQPSYKIFVNNFKNLEGHVTEQEDISNNYNYFEKNNNITKKAYKYEGNDTVEGDTEYCKSDLFGRKKTTLISDIEMITDNSVPTSEQLKETRKVPFNNHGLITSENVNNLSYDNGENTKNSDPVTNELITSPDLKKIGSTSTLKTDSVYTSLSDRLSDGDWRDRMDEISNDSEDSYFLARMFDKPVSALRTLRTWDGESADENMDTFTGLDCV